MSRRVLFSLKCLIDSLLLINAIFLLSEKFLAALRSYNKLYVKVYSRTF